MGFSIIYFIKKQQRKLKLPIKSPKYVFKILNLSDEIINEIFSLLPPEIVYYLLFLNKQIHEINKRILKKYLYEDINIDDNHVVKNNHVYWDKSEEEYYTVNSGAFRFEGNLKLVYNKYKYMVYFYKSFDTYKFNKILPHSIYNIKIFKVCYKQVVEFEAISSFIKRMSQLEHLELICYRSQLTLHGVFDMLNTETLKILKLKCYGTLNLFGLDRILQFKKLYKLKLDGSFLDHGQFKPTKVLQCDSIQCLKMKERIYYHSFGKYFYLPNLMSLKLLFNPKDDYDINTMLTGINKLHNFGLITSNLLFNIKLDCFDNLRELYIKGDIIIQQFIESKINLNSIELIQFSQIRHSDKAYKASKWSSQPDIIKSQVRNINFKDCAISIQEIIYIINHFDSIEKVKIQYGNCFSFRRKHVNYYGNLDRLLILIHKSSFHFPCNPLPPLKHINYLVYG